jgi:hypothetical protein
MGFPVCRACRQGELVPLSDYGPEGASLVYKAWVCTNPGCGVGVKVTRGELTRFRARPAASSGRRAPAPPRVK